MPCTMAGHGHDDFQASLSVSMAASCTLRQVKKKMTCEEFIRNNRGINDGADLPQAFLRELYAQHQPQPRSASPPSSRRTAPRSPRPCSGPTSRSRPPARAAASCPRRVCCCFWHCRSVHPLLLQEQVGRSGSLGRTNKDQHEAASPCMHDRAGDVAGADARMFGLLWGPTLAAVSVVLDHAEDGATAAQALRGLLLAARVGAAHRVDEVGHAAVHALFKFIPLRSSAMWNIGQATCMTTPLARPMRCVFMRAASLRMCLAFLQVLDSLIVSLSKYTALLNPASPRAAVVFGNDEKARLATSTLFELVNRCGLFASCPLSGLLCAQHCMQAACVHAACKPEIACLRCRYGDCVRSGWRNVLDCVIRLHRLGLLPADVVRFPAELATT